jgi:hypothetical protein
MSRYSLRSEVIIGAAPIIELEDPNRTGVQMVNTTRLAEWSEIIGAVVIVLSLFYVGYQVKQNTDAIQAETLNNVTSDLSDIFSMPIEKEVAELMVKARNNPSSISEVEQEQLFAFFAKHVATY